MSRNEEGLVFRADDYLYSRVDYAGGKEILDNVFVIKYDHTMQSCGN
jgi:hypothetical protein